MATFPIGHLGETRGTVDMDINSLLGMRRDVRYESASPLVETGSARYRQSQPRERPRASACGEKWQTDERSGTQHSALDHASHDDDAFFATGCPN